MKKGHRKATARALLERFGKSFADEIGIDLARNTPAPLFQLLCASLLYSARIPTDSATQAMRALLGAGLTTPRKMAAASWQDRVDVLTAHGYKRYDEKTSTMLGQAADSTLEWYDGDLRNLRAEADGDLDAARRLLTEFKGIGAVGADIFLREIQDVWTEFCPFADDRVLGTAQSLGLGSSADDLAELIPASRFSALTAALIRARLAGAMDELRHAS